MRDADPQDRPQGEGRGGQPHEGQQPRSAPPQGDDEPAHAEDGQHEAEHGRALVAGDQVVRADLVVDDAVVVVLGRQPGQPVPGHVRGRREQPQQPDPVGVVGTGERRRRDGRPVRRHLLGHGDDLRRRHHQGRHHGHRQQPQPAEELPQAGEQPRQQREHRHDRHQDGRLLVGQQRCAHDHAQDHRAAPARPASQQHRGLQGQRDEQLARREVDQVPALVGDHRGQAEERARGESRGLRAHPQPCHPVHRVAQQPRQQHGQQVVGGGRPEGQRDRREQQTGQRHERVEPQLRADRGGDGAGEPGVGQVHELVCEPPEAPHVRAGVARGGQLVVGQVGDPRPGHQDSRAEVGGEDHQVAGDGTTRPAGHPAERRAAAGRPRPGPARRGRVPGGGQARAPGGRRSGDRARRAVRRARGTVVAACAARSIHRPTSSGSRRQVSATDRPLSQRWVTRSCVPG